MECANPLENGYDTPNFSRAEKRYLSVEARAKIAAALKKRWEKVKKAVK
jgi:hypothetical protein